MRLLIHTNTNTNLNPDISHIVAWMLHGPHWLFGKKAFLKLFLKSPCFIVAKTLLINVSDSVSVSPQTESKMCVGTNKIPATKLKIRNLVVSNEIKV